jgi:hypothetical protein
MRQKEKGMEEAEAESRTRKKIILVGFLERKTRQLNKIAAL